MSALLQLEDLSKRFAGLRAVEGLSAVVAEGEIVGLIGPNGAGKTTTLNLITGFLRPDRGAIHFAGHLITGQPPHAVARQGICRTFQIARPFRDMTVLENALVGALARTADLAEAEVAARRALALTGLEARADALAGELTAIDQRRLEVARAVGTRPGLLLLDETMAGLNPAEVEVALALIRGLRREGLTVLVIEHNVRAILTLCDRVLVLDHGQKIAEGAAAEVARDPKVVAAYLGTETDA